MLYLPDHCSSLMYCCDQIVDISSPKVGYFFVCYGLILWMSPTQTESQRRLQSANYRFLHEQLITLNQRETDNIWCLLPVTWSLDYPGQDAINTGGMIDYWRQPLLSQFKNTSGLKPSSDTKYRLGTVFL